MVLTIAGPVRGLLLHPYFSFEYLTSAILSAYLLVPGTVLKAKDKIQSLPSWHPLTHKPMCIRVSQGECLKFRCPDSEWVPKASK